MEQNRFKSWALWGAIAALLGLILNDAGLVAPEKYQEYVNLVLAILVAGGIVNNPTSKDKL